MLALRRDINEKWTSNSESGAGQRAYIAHKETANLVKVCPLKFSPQPLMNPRNAFRKTLRRDRIQVFLLRRDNYPKANLGMHPLIGGVN